MELLRLVDDLRQGHALLCGKLAVLKEAESYNITHFWHSLQSACARLTTGLLEHIRREERLLVTHHRSLGAANSETISRPSSRHYGDYRYLQVITRSISLESRPFLLNGRYQLFTDFLSGLQRNMDKDEEKVRERRLTWNNKEQNEEI